MIELEMKRKAEEYAEENNVVIYCDCNDYESKEDLRDAYLAGAVKILNQIRKMDTSVEDRLDRVENILCQLCHLHASKVAKESRGKLLKECHECTNLSNWRRW